MHRPQMLIDGRPGHSIPATDRGLHYGDGVFETIAVRRGQPCLWPQHLSRLQTGCERLGIPAPDISLLTEEVAQLLAPNGGDGVLKLTVTRGSGPRGYAPPPVPKPRRIFSFTPGLSVPTRGSEAGVRLTLCETRLGENASLAGIKHLNRLEQVLARAEWSDPSIVDGLMCDGHGHVVCGTKSNLYVLDDAGIATPPLLTCGVVGTVRSVVADCARALDIAFAERSLRPTDLFAARGLFISNALLGAVPVARLGTHCYRVDAVPAALIERVRQSALEPETRM